MSMLYLTLKEWSEVIVTQINRKTILDEDIRWQLKTMMIKNWSSDAILELKKMDTWIAIEECIKWNPIKLLLVSSYWILSENWENTTTPSYGIRNIASYINSTRNDTLVHVLDPNFVDSEETIVKHITECSYDVIWLSAIPANIWNDLKILSLLRKSNPNAKIIIWWVQSHSLQSFHLEKYLDIDAIVVGDWFTAFDDILTNKPTLWNAKILKYPLKNLNTDKITYLHPQYEDDDIIHNRLNRITNNQDTLYLKVSNACKWICYRCVSPKDSTKYNTTNDFRKELESIQWLDAFKSIVFQDNDISFSKDFYINLTKDIQNIQNPTIENFKRVPKFWKSRIEEMDTGLLEALKELNFVRIAYWIESFDEKSRIWLEKFYSNKDYETVIEQTIQKKIIPEINLILFNPYESLESLNTTLIESRRWLEKWAIVFITFWLYAVPKSSNSKLDMKDNIEYKEYLYPWMKQKFYAPWRYKVKESLQPIFKKVENEYLLLISYYNNIMMEPLTVPFKNILKLIALWKILWHDISFFENYLHENKEFLFFIKTYRMEEEKNKVELKDWGSVKNFDNEICKIFCDDMGNTILSNIVLPWWLIIEYWKIDLTDIRKASYYTNLSWETVNIDFYKALDHQRSK
jgi:hypothetical protein